MIAITTSSSISVIRIGSMISWMASLHTTGKGRFSSSLVFYSVPNRLGNYAHSISQGFGIVKYDK